MVAAGVGALAASTGVEAGGVTQQPNRIKGPATAAMSRKSKKSRHRGQFALTAVVEATSPAAAP